MATGRMSSASVPEAASTRGLSVTYLAPPEMSSRLMAMQVAAPGAASAPVSPTCSQRAAHVASSTTSTGAWLRPLESGWVCSSTSSAQSGFMTPSASLTSVVFCESTAAESTPSTPLSFSAAFWASPSTPVLSPSKPFLSLKTYII